jgi:hypothetical protein
MVDIVEGANDRGPNTASLYTTPGMWSAVTAIAQFVVAGTELAFRVHYASGSRGDWVSFHLLVRTHVVADTIIFLFLLCPIANPLIWTAAAATHLLT